LLCGGFVSGGLKLGEAVEEHVDARDDLRRSARLQLDFGHDGVGVGQSPAARALGPSFNRP
jgi:hypothetical protein